MAKTRKGIERVSEHSEQASVIQWARMNSNAYPPLRWLHSSLNGIYIPASAAVRYAIINKMKAAGQTNGIPDLFLPYPVGGYHGLYIEMKADGGTLRDEQRDFIDYANEVGYSCVVCHGFDEAIDAIMSYLETDEIPY